MRYEKGHKLYTLQKELDIERADPANKYFFSLVRSPTPKKKRLCTACRDVFFKSSGFGHRLCTACDKRINRYQGAK